MVTFEEKDLRRLQDIKAQPGKELGLAGKQAKLIKDRNKAFRRYSASLEVFGGSHTVTNIFWRRYQELGGDIVVQTAEKVIVVEHKVVEKPVEAPSFISRTKNNFPLESEVKIGEREGVVTSHEGADDQVEVKFQDCTEFVSIYSLKRC